LNRLLRAYDTLIEGLLLLAGLVMAAVCLLIVADVVMRNLGLSPPDSTVALTEYALLYITMAAAPALVRSRGHIVVELLLQRLGLRIRRVLDRVVLLACAAIALAVAGLACALAVEAVQRGEIDVRSLDISRACLFAPVVVGFALMAVEFIRLLIRGEDLVRPPGERETL